MPLDNTDLVRIMKYRAYTMGDWQGGAFVQKDIIDIIRSQMTDINENDTEYGLTIGDTIKAELGKLDTLDTQINAAAANDGIKVLGIGTGIEYFGQGAQSEAFHAEFERIRKRVADLLSQSVTGTSTGSGVLYRG